MKLTKEQAEKVKELFKKYPDIKKLTQLIFDDESLDGRTQEGRAVKRFLVKEGLQYKTTLVEKVTPLTLTEEQQAFLLGSRVEMGMKPIEITRLLFNRVDIQPLGIENRTVLDFLRKHRPDIIDEDDIIVVEKWKPPIRLVQAIKKVNDWTGRQLNEGQMTTKDRKCCEQLLLHLKSPRFSNFINQYKSVADRDLFESEFIRSVWDKPDLTIDELNLYITVCGNYVRQKHIQKRLDVFNHKLENMENADQDVNMRFNELIKNTSDELNACEKRIETLVQKLNGDRAKRLSEQGKDTVSIVALVEAFQEFQERERLVHMADMENELASDEADRLESMDEMKARVLGISKRELL